MNLAETEFSLSSNASRQNQMLEQVIRLDDVSVEATSAV